MLTHIDSDGRPTMADVSSKAVTSREATAQTTIHLPPEVAALIKGGDIMTKKGPVLSTAIIAGTMAVKRTFELIPFCHPIPIDSIKFDSRWESDEGEEKAKGRQADLEGSSRLILSCTVKNIAKTGIEMEALTGVSIAALTVYDMCKALSHDMIIGDTRLMAKSGGKRDVQKF